MPLTKEFPNAMYPPLSREEMISLIEGKGAPRPAVIVHGHWLHIDILSPEKREPIEKLHELYPCDAQPFYMKKPANFGNPGDQYCWCDVLDADPALHREAGASVGVDEETTIEWDIINQISEHVPNPEEEDMFMNAPQPDGRYRIMLVSPFIYNRHWVYRGVANSLMDMYMEPEGVHAVNRKVVKFMKRAMERAVKEADIDAVNFCDDLGMQNGPFMSPEMFREFYFPYYKEVYDYAHELGLHVWQHTCGDIRLIIDQLIEAGVDVLHPIQKFAMKEKEIYEKYKDDLCFWVGFDLQRLFPLANVEEIKQETRFIADTFFQENKGKLIYAISNRLEDNVPLENYIAFIEEAYRYGAQLKEKGRGNNESPAYENPEKWDGKR